MKWIYLNRKNCTKSCRAKVRRVNRNDHSDFTEETGYLTLWGNKFRLLASVTREDGTKTVEPHFIQQGEYMYFYINLESNADE